MTTATKGKKRLLVICTGSLESVATLTRLLNEINLLQRVEGIELRVAWLLNRKYLKDPARREWVESIRQKWSFRHVVCYSLPSVGSSSIDRFLTAAARFIVLVAYIAWRRIEVVQVHSFCGVQGAVLRLAKLLGFRAVLDMQGAHPEEMAFHGMANGALRYLDAREKAALQGCETVFCVSRNMINHLVEKHGVTREKLRILPCCVPKASVGGDPQRRRQARHALGWEGKFVLVYSGGTAAYQCIPETCELFSCLARRWPEAVLLVLSWGDLDIFRRCLERNGIDESRYHLRRLDQKEVSDYLMAGDAGFLLRQDQLLNRVSSPTKFAEYLAAGLPVITTRYAGDFAADINLHTIGIVIDLPPTTDVDSLMEFLREVQSRRQEVCRKCEDYAYRELAWESHERELEDAITG